MQRKRKVSRQSAKPSTVYRDITAALASAIVSLALWLLAVTPLTYIIGSVILIVLVWILVWLLPVKGLRPVRRIVSCVIACIMCGSILIACGMTRFDSPPVIPTNVFNANGGNGGNNCGGGGGGSLLGGGGGGACGNGNGGNGGPGAGGGGSHVGKPGRGGPGEIILMYTPKPPKQ